MKKRCVVVTGLPASGKSTIGIKLSESMRFDFLDKDDYLEQLFDERGIGNSDWRRSLSRASDSHFIHAAEKVESVVLVSHWKIAEKNSDSGTPTDWLNRRFSSIVELYCSCPIETATDRFRARARHPGHLDNQKSKDEITNWMSSYQQGLPLGLGTLVTAMTDRHDFLDDIVEQTKKAFSD